MIFNFPRTFLHQHDRLSIINDIKEQAYYYHLTKTSIGKISNFDDTATKSEKNIIDIIRNSFCNYWTISNPYKIKGQELCDALIIFKNNILIFSDKERNFQEKEFSTDWEIIQKKWKNFYKSLRHSKNQLKQAKDWILSNPNEIYFDNMCENRVSIDLKIDENTKFFLITTVSNWKDVADFYFKNDGFLKIDTNTNRSPEHKTLVLNNIHDELNNNFYHMIDDTFFKKLLKEIDTIPDLINYLIEKEDFFITSSKNNITINANSELSLLGQYLLGLQTNHKEKNFFIYDSYINNLNYSLDDSNYELAKSTNEEIKYDQRKEKSFLIDCLITNFTTVGLRNSTGFNYEIQDQDEKIFRYLIEYLVALCRSDRINLAEAIYKFFLEIPDKNSVFRKFILETKDFNNKVSLQYFVFYICFNDVEKYLDRIDVIKNHKMQLKLQEILDNGFIPNTQNIDMKNIIFIGFDHPLGLKSGSESILIYED